MTMWFEFSQNNSGGFFDGPHYVVVEAANADEANRRAVDEGPCYFDGVERGLDCEFSGDRWYECYREGTETPTIYGKPASEYESVLLLPLAANA